MTSSSIILASYSPGQTLLQPVTMPAVRACPRRACGTELDMHTRSSRLSGQANHLPPSSPEPRQMSSLSVQAAVVSSRVTWQLGPVSHRCLRESYRVETRLQQQLAVVENPILTVLKSQMRTYPYMQRVTEERELLVGAPITQAYGAMSHTPAP